ncbi:MAG: CPBP family intramembrane metalloprotease [Oscillospiraceae bacterium]|nr:CPBP family intramembrane metalloprotease [Oscillospiraceae bacterium]
MKKRQPFLAADPEYAEQLTRFSVLDAVLALAYYLLILVVYYFMGRTVSLTGRYLGVPVNLALLLLPVLLCLKHLSAVGLSLRNLGRSLLAAAVPGILYLLSFSIIPGIVSRSPLLPAGRILYNLFYYFIVIAMSEEVGFRGFIQPRLMPLLKREWLCILVGGILFVLMHYPYQMAARGMGFSEYLPRFLENAPMQLLLHFVFTWYCRRYGNLFGSTLLHGCVDMTMGIFG